MIKTIPESKIQLHLKLGRTLVQFVKTDIFFEDKTFDWMQLEKIGETYQATLIRSVDQGDELFNDVLGFEILNTVDQEDTDTFQGDLETVLHWAVTTYGISRSGFHSPDKLKMIYLELVEKGLLGDSLGG